MAGCGNALSSMLCNPSVKSLIRPVVFSMLAQLVLILEVLTFFLGGGVFQMIFIHSHVQIRITLLITLFSSSWRFEEVELKLCQVLECALAEPCLCIFYDDTLPFANRHLASHLTGTPPPPKIHPTHSELNSRDGVFMLLRYDWHAEAHLSKLSQSRSQCQGIFQVRLCQSSSPA